MISIFIRKKKYFDVFSIIRILPLRLVKAFTFLASTNVLHLIKNKYGISGKRQPS